MRSILPAAGALLLCALPALQAQSPAESAHDLVKDVVYNELQERRQISLWQYRVEKRVGSQTTVEQEVETLSGPVYRVLARQDKPLDPAGQKKETDRLNNLLHNPTEQARKKQDHEAEEQRGSGLLPHARAFVYSYDGMDAATCGFHSGLTRLTIPRPTRPACITRYQDKSGSSRSRSGW